jgi:hypothetical protein
MEALIDAARSTSASRATIAHDLVLRDARGQHRVREAERAMHPAELATW